MRNQGIDGTGVKVGVLDSGIDYTHANLGGPGTAEAYNTCNARQHRPRPDRHLRDALRPDRAQGQGRLPTSSARTGRTPPVQPDPNPIDFEGHGTHVSDIIGGRSADGTHKGIAPGVDLYALKVCSSVSTACSGVGILEAIDWAMDPNGDGDISDALDIINLSLGSAYGQEQDDSTVAIDNAVRAGIVAVISAGNGADRPFIVGSPSTAARAISVAQTALPDDKLQTIATDKGITVRNSKLQTWSPGADRDDHRPAGHAERARSGARPADFAAFPAGAVALIARGTCNASLKSQNAQAAGASAVIIYNNVPGDPPDFSFGGGDPVTIPTYTISQADGQTLPPPSRPAPSRSPSTRPTTTSLTNTVVGTSSRGPAISGVRAEAGHRRARRVAVRRGRHRQRDDQLRRHLGRGSGRHRRGGADPRQVPEDDAGDRQGAAAQRGEHGQPDAGRAGQPLPDPGHPDRRR